MPESRSVAPPARQGRRRLIAAAIAVLAVLALAWWLWPKDTAGPALLPAREIGRAHV